MKPYIGIIAPFSYGEGKERTFTRGTITKQEWIDRIWQIGGIPISMHWKENDLVFNVDSFSVIDALFIPKGPIQVHQICALKFAIDNLIPVLLEDRQILEYINSDYETIKTTFPSSSSQKEILENLENQSPILIVGSYRSSTTSEDVYNSFIETTRNRRKSVDKNKPVVGIIPQRNSLGFTRTVYTYPDSIIDENAIPLTIHMPIINGKIEFKYDVFDRVDGILIPGGSLILPEQVCTVKCAIENEIPFLGICAGMQTLGAYNWFRMLYGDIDYETIMNKYNVDIDESNFMYKITSSNVHNYSSTFYQNNVQDFLHPILLSGNISKFYEEEYLVNGIPYISIVLAPSVHNWALKRDLLERPDSLFNITAVAGDGTIEAIELKNNNSVVGLQYHPELFRKSEYIRKNSNLLYATSHRVIFKNFVSTINEQLKNKKKYIKIKSDN